LRFPPGWGVRETVDMVLGPASSAVEIADYQLTAQLVRAGFGTTLMPIGAVEERWALVTVRVSDVRLRWSLSAATNAAHRPSAATSALLACLVRAAGSL
jgi:DNA-binding transcriptional LysR family regulator